MKKYVLGLLLLSSAVGLLGACKESDRIPAPAVDEYPIIFPQVSADTSKNYINFDKARVSDNLLAQRGWVRPTFEFTISPTGPNLDKLQAVEVYASYKRGPNVGPRVKVGEFSTFPATFSTDSRTLFQNLQRLTSSSAGELIPITPTNPATQNFTQVAQGDQVLFTFEYVTENGGITLTPLTTIRLGTPNGGTTQVVSGTQINPPYSLLASVRKSLI